MKDIISGYRRIAGMKQSDMAKLFNISRQSYWNKENGRTPFTDEEKIIFKNEVAKVIPEISLEKIFFNQKVGK
ncbi:transcriptional regulator [Carnobacterium sp. ISL-102]|uniref:helix-turn-helix transcriptional regulator n=1 Tax=Carnobacterium sp. ISL-102 TaxID=2819142 RepID=UPI001BE8A124|nr:transcriptional regulator [Carnobacterium sp. ISL-102]MBT2731661.1 transcriptional regulator [Carnobacterium sp. ISL-102]